MKVLVRSMSCWNKVIRNDNKRVTNHNELISILRKTESKLTHRIHIMLGLCRVPFAFCNILKTVLIEFEYIYHITIHHLGERNAHSYKKQWNMVLYSGMNLNPAIIL
jgi:hypothetical protein